MQSYGSRSTEPALAGMRVLLVEDEAIVAIELQAALEDAGAEVQGPYFSLDDAMPVAASERLDAAILDVLVQDVEVFPLADALADREIPFIFHSGHALPHDVKRRFASTPLLMKPASPRSLINQLSGVLESGHKHS